MNTSAHPYELAEMQEESPTTDRCPISPKVDRPNPEIAVLNANGSVVIASSAIVPGHKDYANFQEFWDDPCWGGPIDWKAR